MSVVYAQYVETSRLSWIRNMATRFDTNYATEWTESWAPKGGTLMLKSTTTEFTLVGVLHSI